MTSPALLTPRLQLRAFQPSDAAFVLELVNSPGWLRYIGDRGVRTLVDAERYLQQGPLASYARHGFGLLHVSLREHDLPVGMCGLLRRESLPDVELGFAFLPAATGRGYATEAARAIVQDASSRLGLAQLAAIVQPDNFASGRVLTKLGFTFARAVRLGEPPADLHLFTVKLGSTP